VAGDEHTAAKSRVTVVAIFLLFAFVAGVTLVRIF
jgi:hypothetical protein